jgi:hypothetical protein
MRAAARDAAWTEERRERSDQSDEGRWRLRAPGGERGTPMSDPYIDLVRRSRPDDVPDDPAVRARAYGWLGAEFTEAPVHTRRGRVPWRLMAAATALVVGAAVVIVETGRSTPHRAPAPLTLELVAQRVEQQPVPRPRPDQWVYSPELHNWEIAPGNTIGVLRGKIKVEEWWRFDGTHIAKSVQGSKLEVVRVLRPGEKLRRGDIDSSPRVLYDFVAKLPTDPDALLTKIRHDVRDSGRDVSTFGRITQIIEDDKLIPPKTNAALYRALAKISGVRLVPGVTDLAGRPGVAVTRTEGRNRIEVVLDPSTFRYLGYRTVAAADEWAKGKLFLRAGEVVSAEADLGARVVDRMGER